MTLIWTGFDFHPAYNSLSQFFQIRGIRLLEFVAKGRFWKVCVLVNKREMYGCSVDLCYMFTCRVVVVDGNCISRGLIQSPTHAAGFLFQYPLVDKPTNITQPL